jgi:hypothetical protein
MHVFGLKWSALKAGPTGPPARRPGLGRKRGSTDDPKSSQRAEDGPGKRRPEGDADGAAEAKKAYLANQDTEKAEIAKRAAMTRIRAKKLEMRLENAEEELSRWSHLSKAQLDDME